MDNDRQVLTWALEAYTRSTEALMTAATVKDMADQVCREIVAHDRYTLALVGLLSPDQSGRLDIISAAGGAIGYTGDLLLSSNANDPGGLGPSGLALRSGERQIVTDTLTDAVFVPWRERAVRFGIRSSISMPIVHSAGIAGIVIVYAATPNAFFDIAVDLFTDLARKIALSINMFEKRAEATFYLNDLQAQTRKYDTVMSMTSEGFVTVSDDGRIIDANNAYCHDIGYEKTEIVGKYIADFSYSHSGDDISNDMSFIKKTGKIALSTLHRHKNGSLVPFRVNISYDKSLGERFFAFFHNMSDLEKIRSEFGNLQKSHEEQRREAFKAQQMLVSVSEETLRQIGRDLHDDVGQILTGGGMLAADLGNAIATAPAAVAIKKAETLATLFNQATQRLRSIAQGLYPTALDAVGLIGAIHSLIDDMGTLPGFTFAFHHDDREPDLSAEQRLHFYRIAQEAVTNAVRHSRGSQILVTLTADDKAVRLTVEDNGLGIAWRERQKFKRGMGLTTMQARASGIGAALRITTRRSGGVVVKLTLPLQRKAAR